MAPIIRAVLSTLLSPKEASEIEIIANDVKFTDPEQKGNTWEIVYRHPQSGFGHDKSKAILPYRDLESSPTLFFCGDGVSGELILRLGLAGGRIRAKGKGGSVLGVARWSIGLSV
jgi:2-hydroxy-3-keto-5-methylthiopentenyl-1-phosphate phosphatase